MHDQSRRKGIHYHQHVPTPTARPPRQAAPPPSKRPPAAEYQPSQQHHGVGAQLVRQTKRQTTSDAANRSPSSHLKGSLDPSVWLEIAQLFDGRNHLKDNDGLIDKDHTGFELIDVHIDQREDRKYKAQKNKLPGLEVNSKAQKLSYIRIRYKYVPI